VVRSHTPTSADLLLIHRRLGRGRSSLFFGHDFRLGQTGVCVWDVISFVVLIGGGYFISDVLLLGRGYSDWFGFSQGMSIVFVCLFTLNWCFSRKLMAVV